MKMIDPPKGWWYGFPKPIPETETDVRAWLVKEGYPQQLIDELGDQFHVRVWEQPKEEKK